MRAYKVYGFGSFFADPQIQENNRIRWFVLGFPLFWEATTYRDCFFAGYLEGEGFGLNGGF